MYLKMHATHMESNPSSDDDEAYESGSRAANSQIGSNLDLRAHDTTDCVRFHVVILEVNVVAMKMKQFLSSNASKRTSPSGLRLCT